MFTDSIIFKEKICCSFLPIGVGEGLPVTKLGQSVFFRGRHKCMASYLVWCLWLIMEENGVIFVLRVFVGLKRIIEDK